MTKSESMKLAACLELTSLYMRREGLLAQSTKPDLPTTPSAGPPQVLPAKCPSLIPEGATGERLLCHINIRLDCIIAYLNCPTTECAEAACAAYVLAAEQCDAAAE